MHYLISCSSDSETWIQVRDLNMVSDALCFFVGQIHVFFAPNIWHMESFMQTHHRWAGLIPVAAKRLLREHVLLICHRMDKNAKTRTVILSNTPTPTRNVSGENSDSPANTGKRWGLNAKMRLTQWNISESKQEKRGCHWRICGFQKSYFQILYRHRNFMELHRQKWAMKPTI